MPPPCTEGYLISDLAHAGNLLMDYDECFQEGNITPVGNGEISRGGNALKGGLPGMTFLKNRNMRETE